jgi:hypothetical protein
MLFCYQNQNSTDRSRSLFDVQREQYTETVRGYIVHTPEANLGISFLIDGKL